MYREAMIFFSKFLLIIDPRVINWWFTDPKTTISGLKP